MPFIHSVEYIKHFDKAAQRNNARKIFIAFDNKGKVLSGIYLLYDFFHATYYLMGGGDPLLRSSGAQVLTMWECIKFASTVSQVFDFEGSMSEPIERFFRSFGAIQKPYFRITKYNSTVFKIGHKLRNFYNLRVPRNY